MARSAEGGEKRKVENGKRWEILWKLAKTQWRSVERSALRFYVR
ncbi:hypothetical protein [Haemophilus paracuniculus]|nr:hypothetical protein [Haemophilus paracuniculus]